MSAANPFSVSSMDDKPSEPSMEEILASIRRIIADDQSIPGHGALAGGLRAPGGERPVASPPAPAYQEPTVHNAPEQAPPARPPLDVGSSTAPVGVDADDPSPAQHGFIAAPQYPTPDGPIDQRHASETFAGRDWSMPLSARRLSPDEAPQAEPDLVDPPADQAFAEPEIAEATASAAADAEFEEDYYAYDESEEDGHPYDAPLATAQQDQPQDAPGLFSAETDASIASAFNMLAATRLADNSDELMTMVRDMIRPLLRSWLDDNLPSMVERMVRAEIERVARGGR